METRLKNIVVLALTVFMGYTVVATLINITSHLEQILP